MSDEIDLDRGAAMSRRASSGDFAVWSLPVDAPPAADPDHPAPCCWMAFGRDQTGSYFAGGVDVDVRISINGDNESLVTSAGAIADAELVAWLLTHRDELIRLARIGQASEATP